jgi:hypothetical protein
MSDFDINILIDDQYKQQQKKLDVYNKILNKIYNKIKIVNKRKKTDLIYEIPNYIFGFPLYNNRTCTVFIISSMRKKGFLVKFNFPNILYISWDDLVKSNIKKVTSDLMKTNNNNLKVHNKTKNINKHFNKLNKNLMTDLDDLINDSPNLNSNSNLDEEIKKLNELSSFSEYYQK